jgi:hypothetical protein
VGALAWQAAGPGGVASGSGGEAPDPGSPRGEGNKRARICTSTTTSTSTSTSTSIGAARCPPKPLITARHASRTAVVSSPELLEHVLTFLLTFLAGGKQEAREDLGRAALVCRSWREAVLGEEVWGRVASELMPAMGRRVSEVGARRYVLKRGHCIRDVRAWVGWTWSITLALEVEVWDMLDETCLLATEGRMGISAHPYVLRLKGPERVEVVGPAFSAASRDPVQRRFASIDDYFRRGPDTVKAPISVRVYVRDYRTGRQALLWDLACVGELQCEDVPPDDPFSDHLPEGSRRVTQPASLPIYSPTLPGKALRARVGFYVRLEAGQEGVAEEDKIWRMAGGDQDSYGDHDSFFSLRFDDNVNDAKLAFLIRGLPRFVRSKGDLARAFSACCWLCPPCQAAFGSKAQRHVMGTIAQRFVGRTWTDSRELLVCRPSRDAQQRARSPVELARPGRDRQATGETKVPSADPSAPPAVCLQRAPCLTLAELRPHSWLRLRQPPAELEQL